MNQVAPLHEYFPEWYDSLSNEQQMYVRKVLVSVYHHDIAEALSRMFYLRDLENLNESEQMQLVQEIDDFVAGGTLGGFLGEYAAELVTEDLHINTFPDLLGKLTEIIAPADGSVSDYSTEMAAMAGLPVDAWTKATLGDLSSDLKEAFPQQAEQFALEWQRKRAMSRGEKTTRPEMRRAR